MNDIKLEDMSHQNAICFN